jgi:urease accessory protein
MNATLPVSQQPAAAAGWCATASLQFQQRYGRTQFQGGASAPLKLMRSTAQSSGHCELPLLHTAGGLVGGDQLQLQVELAAGSRALRRSRRHPQGSWAAQRLHVRQAAGSDLEWLPQELVLYADALYEQTLQVELAAGASFLGVEVVRLGRSAAGENLGEGCWRSRTEIRRLATASQGERWELVDRLQLSGEALHAEHGMAGQPVFGSLVWAAPEPIEAPALQQLLEQAREARTGLEGSMACGPLDQGLVARYRGPSSQAARFWFCRMWALIRAQRGQAAPELPRVWPFQEQPLQP